jgi:hypothetical protein
MKKIILSVAAILCMVYTLQAQVPQAINYQAVARTSQGLLIPDQQVSVRFSILEGSVNGTIVYQETTNATTNNFGLFTHGIGSGNPVTGTFAGINWGNGNTKFLKVEIAPQVNGTYTLQGTTQIMSVPFALYAEKTRLLAGNNTINVTNGNTISGNYVAGTGVTITGNIISSLGSSKWTNDTYGIFYENTLGGIGVGGNTESNNALTVTQKTTGGFSGAAVFKGSDTWQTVIRIDNTSSIRKSYQLQVAGSGNTAVPPGAFALYNATPISDNDRFVFVTNGSDNSYLGIGSYTNRATAPRSRLHVFAGDVNIDQIGSGIIMKSPNGQCWRVTIDNSGNFIRTAIVCP